MRYLVIFEPTATGFSAYSPDVLGCIAAGATLEETRQLMQEALALHLEDMRATGQPLPKAATTVEQIEVNEPADAA